MLLQKGIQSNTCLRKLMSRLQAQKDMRYQCNAAECYILNRHEISIGFFKCYTLKYFHASFCPIIKKANRFRQIKWPDRIYPLKVCADPKRSVPKPKSYSQQTKGPILYLVFCHSHNAYQQCLPSSSVQSYRINIAKAL